MPIRILVVDDEPDVELLFRQRLRRKIRDETYAFVFALNGVDALTKFEQEQDFDLVLSDINMPKMDGLSLLANLKNKSNYLKTIMVSAYGDMKNIRTAMNGGAFDFVTKPIDFSDLEATINKAIGVVNNLKQAERTRKELTHIQRDLAIASQVQKSSIPSDFQAVANRHAVDLHAEMLTAKAVGGDFYDYYSLDDHRLAFVIGDVSGKGMPAALFMSVSKTLLKATMLRGAPLKECVSTVNTLLCQDNARGMFLTLFFGILDLSSKELIYCNCGHNPPAMWKNGGEVELFEKSTNIPLGIREEFEFETIKIGFAKGTVLSLYTDGVTEAINSENQRFGDQRLLEFLRNKSGCSPQQVIHHLIEHVQDFTNGMPQSDDITVLILKNSA